jgi:hypothetical protein
MPKKTRKQKILAQLHRKLNTISNLEPQTVKPQNVRAVPASISLSPSLLTFSNNAVPEPKKIISTADYSYVKHDLIKITIFTISVLILQGVLYFVVNRG